MDKIEKAVLAIMVSLCALAIYAIPNESEGTILKPMMLACMAILLVWRIVTFVDACRRAEVCGYKFRQFEAGGRLVKVEVFCLFFGIAVMLTALAVGSRYFAILYATILCVDLSRLLAPVKCEICEKGLVDAQTKRQNSDMIKYFNTVKARWLFTVNDNFRDGERT